MNARSLTQQVPLFVLLSIAALGLSLTAAEARSPLAGVGSAMFAAALADFLLGVGAGLSLPRRVVAFAALKSAGFVLAGASLRIADPGASRMMVPLGASLFGASLAYLLAGRRNVVK